MTNVRISGESDAPHSAHRCITDIATVTCCTHSAQMPLREGWQGGGVPAKQGSWRHLHGHRRRQDARVPDIGDDAEGAAQRDGPGEEPWRDGLLPLALGPVVLEPVEL